jgi:hypothetical protein
MWVKPHVVVGKQVWGGGVWIASTPLHNIIYIQAQPHNLIFFTISAMIKIILNNY